MHNNEFLKHFSRILRFAESILPIFFWLLLIYGFDEPYVAGVTVISAIIHESGHELYLYFHSGRVSIPKGTARGFIISPRKNLSYQSEIRLYIAGPAANILAALLSFPFIFLFGEPAVIFTAINSATAISNLLPIEGYDGYGVIRTLFELHGSGTRAFAVLEGISFSLVAFLCFAALYLMDRCDAGYWIYALFIISLISKIKKRLPKQNSAF